MAWKMRPLELRPGRKWRLSQATADYTDRLAHTAASKEYQKINVKKMNLIPALFTTLNRRSLH
jgi:hypothetical protein